MRRSTKGAAALVLVLGATTAVAYADKSIYATPPNQFVGGDITIDQGEKVTFTNADTVTHDVTANVKGPDGRPLFASGFTDSAMSRAVVGTEYLTTGRYDYFCSIHPFMTGSITVTANGKPVARPGGAPPPGSSPPPPSSPAAVVTPSVRLNVADGRVAAVRRRGALRVGVMTDQAVALRFIARAGRTALASGVKQLTKGGSTIVSLRLTRAGAKLVRRSRALTVSVRAYDADAMSNAALAKAARKLR